MKTFSQVEDWLSPHVDGWLSHPEAELLWRSAGAASGPILEVGSYMGRSAIVLAALERPVICVDPFADGFHDSLSGDEVLARFRHNLEIRNIRNVELIRKRIEDFRPAGYQFGFAYLDGDHTRAGTLVQIGKALLCLRVDPSFSFPAIAIHDVDDNGDGREVRDAALSILGPWDEKVERLAVWRL